MSGLISADFADVRTVMSEMGMADDGFGCCRRRGSRPSGCRAGRGQPAAGKTTALNGARAVIVNITADSSLRMREVNSDGHHQGLHH